MKKYFSPCVFAAVLISPAYAADSGIQWGANAVQVKAAEKSPPKREAVNGAVTYLIFPGTFAGESVSVVDRLMNDKLFEVSYVLESKGRKCAELAKKFGEIASELNARHGAAGATAQSADACNTEHAWDLGDSTVILSLSTKSGRSDLSAVYQSKELAKLAEQVSIHTSSR